MKNSCILFLFLLLLLLASFESSLMIQAQNIKTHFYKNSCPNAEKIVQRIIWKHVARNPELAAKFIRMFFHDCFVRGCDGSILIDSIANNRAEKEAIPNKSLSGFDIIEEAKASLEKVCHGVVSCADILALAARDAVSFQFKKPLWEVQTGRKDGKISLANEADTNLPSPLSNFTTLVKAFANKGLDAKDLVVLSGGHSIGLGHCNFFSSRLYNFTGRGDADPSLDAKYAAFLRSKCRSLTDNTTTVPLDPNANPVSFDSSYFLRLRQRKGLFQSDAALLTNSRARNLVDKLTDSTNFFNAFKNSIRKMGAIAGKDGEIRNKCSVVN